MSRRLRRFLPAGWLLAALLLLAPAAPGLAAGETERILSFDSRVVIHPDAGLTVTETIEVLATGASIRHGLVREFPTRYAGRDGKTATVGFRVLSVRRDGRKEAYHVKDAANGKKIYMGEKDVDLPPGRHTYELTYATDGQIGQFQDFDELYWNVTGNGWRLPIDAATAVIRLPDGAATIRYAGYTGPTGAKGADFAAEAFPGLVRFATTRPLPPGQGLTVAVAFPKGFVHPPTPTERALTSPAFVAASAGLAAVAFFFLVAWWQVGRDPRRGAVAALYYPPDGLSAPAARYLWRMGFDDRTFAAALVDMAVAGGLRIEEPDDAYILSRGSKTFPEASWQRAVLDRLLGPAGAVRLEQANHAAIRAARSALDDALAAAHQGTSFRTNRAYFFLGAALSAGVMAVTALRADDPGMAGVSISWLGIWSFGVAGLTLRARQALRSARRRPGLKTVAAAFFLTLFSVPFWIGELVGAAFLSQAVSVPASAALAIIGILNAVFWHLLKAPTATGRRTMDDLEGFRLYLSVGERERLNLLNPPERTPELFEKYLPYALALDVENAWAAQFADVLDKAAAAGYAPAWYMGRSFDGNDFSGFADGLGGGFSSAIAAAATAPGSSSGSGGGGSSGGGGGGGGGGGW